LHTNTNDRISSYRKPTAGTLLPPLAVRMSPQHVNRRYIKATYVHRLFVRVTAASVGVFAPQAKKSVQIRPIYTEGMRYLDRFVQWMLR
jgi:hypothetical protein